MSEGEKGFDQWAVVELFGHQQIAGRVTEAQIGGGSFIRVDVPDTMKRDEQQPGFTKYYGPSAIYGITPCAEEIARRAAQEIEAYRKPVPVGMPTVVPGAYAPPARIAPPRESWEGEDDERDDDAPF